MTEQLEKHIASLVYKIGEHNDITKEQAEILLSNTLHDSSLTDEISRQAELLFAEYREHTNKN
jgi:hypothetical protein